MLNCDDSIKFGEKIMTGTQTELIHSTQCDIIVVVIVVIYLFICTNTETCISTRKDVQDS